MVSEFELPCNVYSRWSVCDFVERLSYRGSTVVPLLTYNCGPNVEFSFLYYKSVCLRNTIVKRKILSICPTILATFLKCDISLLHLFHTLGIILSVTLA